MIQVLGLRSHVTNGKEQKRETFFQKGWRFKNVEAVFNADALTKVLASVPEHERWNLYFTVAQCFEATGRKLQEQWAIPFDIDGLELDADDPHLMAKKVATTACEALGADYGKTAVVFTGNGVQLFVRTTSPIIEEAYFDRVRPHYGVLCKRIKNLMTERGLPGNPDVSVWSKGRLMRLPRTMNRKPDKPERMSAVLQGNVAPQEFDVVERAGIALVESQETISDEIIKNYPKPDTAAVCSGCKFLVHCRSFPARVSEPQWYAQISVTARLEDGRSLSHAVSEGHPGYSHYETENKIDQALAAAGPRTCKNIESLWDGCPTCDHYGKVTSPVLIKGPNYIASSDFGFRERKVTEKGVFPGKPAYVDLVRHFKSIHPYYTLVESDQVVIFNGKHWEYMGKRELYTWCNDIVRPEPTSMERNEFVEMLKSSSVIKRETMNQNRLGLLNFQNGVLNTSTKEMTPHGPQYGFFEVLPYAYDARAEAPRWKQFLLDICSNDQLKADTLEEFAGYCISGDLYWLHKVLVLVGDGANGKSVYMRMLGKVVGTANHSAVPAQSLERDTSRMQLMHKLFNYSEETSIHALADSSMFKALSAGGTVPVKQLYVQEFMLENTAKFVMSCNEMPHAKDSTHGLLRRLMIVNLKERFSEERAGYDPHLERNMECELPGICNRLIAAYARLKEHGVFSAREELARTTERFQREIDPLLDFVEERVMLVPDHHTKKEDLYSCYVNYCEAGEFRPLNMAMFYKKFWPRVPTAQSVLHRETSGLRKRFIKGVKIEGDF